MTDDLIARLRAYIAQREKIRDGGITITECNGVPLTVTDLHEAADALEAAREDAERLDWLDTQRGDDVQGSYPEEPQLVGHYWSIDGQCTDVRTAIDAAREARNG